MDVQDHFSEIENTKDIIVVGDRYFTDVLFGNRMGALTVKTDIITPIGENFAVKMVCCVSVSPRHPHGIRQGLWSKF